ncbi:receptor expression-enhancing protein 4 isoform X2 [Harmonia axyridis]|nr:receptor expression-enhancing protein 4 isoform X2 [Harmonia axyridis]
MISSIISRLVILLFGTLYPAYASYKAVKTKNVKEYVKWMMYWIVFALFTTAETFTDVFLSWFPFYYEIKIITVIWLLSPATKGSSILYRKFVHPMLSSKEQEIDEYISKAKEQSYKQVLDIGQKGVTVLMQTAIKSGGGLVNQLRKSYSLSDLNDETDHSQEETDIVPARLIRRRSPHRSSATSSLYFPEIDVRSQQVAHVQSIDDLSSGYSSGEALSMAQSVKIQPRPGVSSTSGSLARSKSTRVTRSTTIPKRASDGEVSEDDSEIFETNIIFPNNKNQEIKKLKHSKTESSSENEFYDSSDKLHDPKVDIHNNNSCPDILTACQNIEVKDMENNLSLPKTSTDDRVDKFRENMEKYNLLVGEKEDNVKITEKPVCRGGKYNKKVAPKPPTEQTKSPDSSEGTIKGTLILKPGIIKTTTPGDADK